MPDDSTGLEDQRQEPTDRKKKERFEEFMVPQSGVSPLTGIEGTLNWGSYNKPTQFSRWSIGDSDADEMINLIPLLNSILQVPGNGPNIATLPASRIWVREQFLNGADYLFSLCTNGHIYQVSVPGGTIVDLGGGFTTTGIVSLANWQGTQIMISDSIQQKIFSWNGSVLTTVFSSQPVTSIRVFSQRLWIFFKSTIVWTNAGTNNSFSGDSGNYIVTDDNCENPIIGGFDVPGALYVWGSNWIKSISNLNTTTVNNVTVLTFTQITLNGNIAPINIDAIILVGNTVYFNNVNGVYAVEGTSIVQISSPFMNGFYTKINPANCSFSMAYGKINNNDCCFVQLYYNGDSQVAASYTVIGYVIANQQWFRFVSYDVNGNPLVLNFITGTVSSAQTNNNAAVWGTDGTNIFQMFTDSVDPVLSQWNGKLWDFGSKLDIDIVVSFVMVLIVTGQTTVFVNELSETNTLRGNAFQLQQSFNPSSGQWVNNAGTLGQWIGNLQLLGNWIGLVQQQYVLAQFDGFGRCRCFGVNVAIQGAQCTIVALVVQYKMTEAGKGS